MACVLKLEALFSAMITKYENNYLNNEFIYLLIYQFIYLNNENQIIKSEPQLLQSKFYCIFTMKVIIRRMVISSIIWNIGV